MGMIGHRGLARYDALHFPQTKGICGELLGEGHSHHVYAHASHPDLVVKLALEGHSVTNTAEWLTWEAGKWLEWVEPWLAPCVDILHGGAVLIQKRTMPVLTEDMPEVYSSWFTDLKAKNFGWYEGRIVCHDYASAHTIALQRGMRRQTKRVQITPPRI